MSFLSRWPFNEWLGVCLALLFMALMCFGSMRSQAPTKDELVDVPSGLSYWQKQDTRLNPEHPPLLKMISAIPLLFTNVRVDYTDPSWCGDGRWDNCEWVFGKKFFEQWNANPQLLLDLARIPMVGVTLLLGFLIYYMARSLAGRWGAALSLVLFVTSPFYLGWGPLSLTDIGLPLFYLASLWTFASLWSNPNGRNLTWFALATAGACLAKFSALLLFPTFLVLWLHFRLSARKQPKPDQHPTVGHRLTEAGSAPERSALLGIALTAVIVYVFYILTCWRSNAARISAERASWFGTNSLAAKMVTHLSWFLPKHAFLARAFKPVWLYTLGVLDVAVRDDRPTFVLGKWYTHGVWFYFPSVSFFKLAPAMVGCFFLLIALLLVYLFHRSAPRIALVPQQYRCHVEALVAALIIFVIATMGSHLNIGIRHFSVPISIVVLLCALLVPLAKANLPDGLQPMSVLVYGVIAISSLATAVTAYPHYISYFNFLRFNIPKQDIVNGSNLYWGQSLIDLEQFREEHHISKVYVDSRTKQSESTYVSGALEWRCDQPQPPAPEWVAVAANFLVREAPTCAGLFRYEHWYVSDQSMVVFHVTDSSYAIEEDAYLRAHPGLHLTVLGAFEELTPSGARLR